MATPIKRVWIDKDVCIGNHLCRWAAPSFFLDTGDWSPEVAPDAAARFEAERERLLEAVFSCPVSAVKLEFADGRVIDCSFSGEMGRWLAY